MKRHLVYLVGVAMGILLSSAFYETRIDIHCDRFANSGYTGSVVLLTTAISCEKAYPQETQP